MRNGGQATMLILLGGSNYRGSLEARRELRERECDVDEVERALPPAGATERLLRFTFEESVSAAFLVSPVASCPSPPLQFPYV